MLNSLRKLCSLNGTSGREENVREYIISEIQGKCDYCVDSMGNILAHKAGKNRAKNKVMISAHMDEVGFIITYICDNGFLKFSSVGDVDSKVVNGRKVIVGEKEISGVISSKAVHLCEGDEDKKVPELSSLYIDIGASSKEEAEKYVNIGDAAYFDSDFVCFGSNKIKAKAIDDRFGCAVMLRMIDEVVEYDTDFAFLVQEEVGLRGAAPAAFTLKPDYAIVLEATTASDVAFVSAEDSVCIQGKGAVVSFMDRSTVYNLSLFKGAFRIAEENNIMIQPKTAVAGGNDAGAIHKSNSGVKTLTISLPCRYIHSGTSVADTRDMEHCYNLAKVLLTEYAND